MVGDRHQYIFLILSQSRLVYVGLIVRSLGFPLFSVVASLSSFFYLMRFLGLPLFICLLSFSLEMVLLQALFLARLMSYWRFYWCTGFSLLVRFFTSVLCGGYFLCLVMLLLGLVSAESHHHVQLIRAELSSKSSSERLSESPSKLSSHQIPRCLGSGGPLQLKGCTRTSTLFSPTTPSGASVLSAFFLHSALHFDFGVEQACSAAARVLLASPSRASPSSASSCLAGRFLMPRCAASGTTLAVGPLSLLLVLRLLS